MRRRPRLDDTQRAIVEALRAAGCSVYSLAACGGGVPDLLVGVRHQTYLLECKGARARGRRKGVVTPAQESWRARWRGWPPVTVKTPGEALAAVGLASGEVCALDGPHHPDAVIDRARGR